MKKYIIFLGLIFILFGYNLTFSQEIYSVPGTYTWTVPPCVEEITVKVWGAGGGGGGSASNQSSSGDDYEACSEGGGAGGGGFAMRTYSVSPGQVYTIVVGAGGTGGIGSNTSAAAANGQIGGTSTFDGPAVTPFGILTGEGGGFGGGARSHNTSGFGHIGDNGAGGLGGNGVNGSTMFKGGNGSAGVHSGSCYDVSGAGGGGAGSAGNGSDGSSPSPCTQRIGGAGGPSEGGKGGDGERLTSYSASRQFKNGHDGDEIGGGGSGSMIHLNSWPNTWTKANGGNGGNGRVIIEYAIAGDDPIQLSPISGPIVVCIGDSENYSVINISGVDYDWSYSGNATIVGQGNEISLNNITSGGTLTVTPSQGCNSGEPQEIEIIVADVPNQPVIVGESELCVGASGTYSVQDSPGVTYTWSYSGSGDMVESGNTVTLENVTTGGTLTVTPSSNCGNGNPATFQIEIIDEPLMPSPIIGEILLCVGSSETYFVDANPDVVFEWSFSGNAVVNETGNSITLENITVGGTLSVIALNDCGESLPQEIEINLLDAPVITDIQLVQPDCTASLGSANIIVEGNENYDYSIDNGQTTQNNGVFTDLSPGSYTVVVINFLGCETTETFTIVPAPNGLDLIINSTDADCDGGGIATVLPQGGTAPFTYSWNTIPVSTTATVSDLFAGSYTVTVTDINGCTATETVEILSSTETPTITNSTIENPSCSGLCDGEISLTVSNGNAPYSYVWTDEDGNVISNNSSQINDLCAGQHLVQITDNNGCVTTGNFELIDQQTIDASFQFDDFCEGGINGPYDIVTPGGSFSFSIAVSDGAMIDAISGVITDGVAGTTYSVSYEVGGNCPQVYENQVYVIPAPDYIVIGMDPSCGNEDGVIIISGLNPLNDYDLSYNANGTVVGPGNVDTNESGTITIDDLPSGTYTDFEVANAYGCITSNNDDVVLEDSENPEITAPIDMEICFGDTITLTAVTANDGVVSWSDGIQNGEEFTPTSLGLNTFVVTIVSGDCQASDEVNIMVNPLPDINAGETQEICEGETATISATGGVTYVWDNNVGEGNSHIVSPNQTTTYIVEGIDANGCKNSSEITVVVHPNPNPDFIGDNLEGCEPLEVMFTNSSGVQNSNCIWDFGDGTSSNECGNVVHTYSSPGSYSVSLTIISENDCSATSIQENYIEVYSNPVADFSASSQEVFTEDAYVNFYNHSQNGISYLWDFGDGSGFESAYEPTHNFTEEGNYIVTLIVTNGADCVDTAKMIILVKEDLLFYVPNTFTPDNDDYNELFQPVFTSGFDPYDFTLLIFNRWGELIFESHNAQKGWDGTYGDKIAKEGAYVWKIEFKTKYNDERKLYYGHVNLLR